MTLAALAPDPAPLSIAVVNHALLNLRSQTEFMNEYAHDYITRVLFQVREKLEADRFGYVVKASGKHTLSVTSTDKAEYISATGQLTVDITRAVTLSKDHAEQLAAYRCTVYSVYDWQAEKVELDASGKPKPEPAEWFILCRIKASGFEKAAGEWLYLTASGGTTREERRAIKMPKVTANQYADTRRLAKPIFEYKIEPARPGVGVTKNPPSVRRGAVPLTGTRAKKAADNAGKPKK
jgi:hypothetical protein